MKNIFAISAIIATAFVFAACGNLEPEKDGNGGQTLKPVYEENVPVPGEDAMPFIILPADGWTVSPGEVIFFKAYLLVDDKYVDVTNAAQTVFKTTYGSGKCVNGDRPDMKNGQEILVSAVYDKKFLAESVGKYIVPAEYEK